MYNPFTIICCHYDFHFLVQVSLIPKTRPIPTHHYQANILCEQKAD